MSVADTFDRHDLTAISGTPNTPDSGLLEVLASVPDPRDPRGLRYPMGLLLAIAILATLPREEVVRHLEECAARAAVSILRGLDRAQVRDHLLDHEQQRLRFSYVLGRRAATASEADDTAVRDPFDILDPPNSLPPNSIATLHLLVATHRDTARRDLDVAGPGEEQELLDLLGEEMDRLLRSDPQFDRIIDALLAEIDKRFGALSIGPVAARAPFRCRHFG